MTWELRGSRMWVAGHRGLVGGALVRRLAREDCTVLTAPRREVDAADAAQVSAFIAREKPDAIVVAAAKVGGILANEHAIRRDRSKIACTGRAGHRSRALPSGSKP